jgi:hypothetical protein
MPASTIVDSRLFVRLEIDTDLKPNLEFASNPGVRGHLASQLLLYDKVAIQTTDFGIVPTLVEWFGEGLFREILASGSITFIHSRNVLAYVPNGHGIVMVRLHGSPSKPLPWWQEVMYSNRDSAIEQQLSYRLPNFSINTRASILQAAMQQVVEFPFSNDRTMDNVIDETYKDTLNLPLLSDLMRKEFPGQDRVLLNHLPIRPDQILFHGGPSTGEFTSAARLMLRIAEINLEIRVARLLGGADLFTAEGSQEIIQNKLSRYYQGNDTIRSYLKLLKLRRIPDLGAAVATGQFPIGEAWKLRQSREARKFREWLRIITISNVDDVSAAYLDALEREPRSASWPVRTLRFVVTTAVGLAGLVPGIIASGADSFLFDKLVGGYSPKLFLNKLDRLSLSRYSGPTSLQVEEFDQH